MSRTSRDWYMEGRLIQGFDYDNQAWVQSGYYLDCGHKKELMCGCYGRLHKGEPTVVTRGEEGGELPPETKLYSMQVDRVETSCGGWIDVRASSEAEAIATAREKAYQGLVIFPAVKPMTEYNPRVDEVQE